MGVYYFLQWLDPGNQKLKILGNSEDFLENSDYLYGILVTFREFWRFCRKFWILLGNSVDFVKNSCHF